MNKNDELKHGKLYGAIFLFLTYAFSLVIQILNDNIDRRAVSMFNSTPIKAVTKIDITYSDSDGNARLVKAGETLDVYITDNRTMSSLLNGHAQLETPGSYIGVKGNDAFDITYEEFKIVD